MKAVKMFTGLGKPIMAYSQEEADLHMEGIVAKYQERIEVLEHRNKELKDELLIAKEATKKIIDDLATKRRTKRK